MTPGEASTGPSGGDASLDEAILDANERMGEALVEIGMALGLPRPGVDATWGRTEILARIATLDRRNAGVFVELIRARGALDTAVAAHALCDSHLRTLTGEWAKRAQELSERANRTDDAQAAEGSAVFWSCATEVRTLLGSASETPTPTEEATDG